MISIIISSYQPEYFAALEKNIAETAGVPYEIIKIDNPGLMGICSAYNTGAKQAKFENLLFIHEDILFHTQNWGEKLINHLEDPETGIIGVAGSDYVPVAPSGWFVKGHSYIHLLQNNKSRTEPELINATTQNKQSVFALDGVFLAMKKEKFEDFRFDEKIAGFHAYDLDISLRFAKKYQNYVIGDILIEHFSVGADNEEWFNESIRVRRKLRSNFITIKNSELEQEMFLIFIAKHFNYYGVSLKTVYRTLEFFPHRIQLKNQFALAKKLMYYLMYSKNYNLKMKTHE